MPISLMVSAALVVTAGEPRTRIEDVEHDRSEALMLQSVMRDLRRDMLRITGAMTTEDWPQVAEAALSVANHPQPSMYEKLQILRFIGNDVERFQGYDQKVREAAMALSLAAQHKDGAAVVGAFSEVQANCLACHQAFREPFQVHF